VTSLWQKEKYFYNRREMRTWSSIFFDISLWFFSILVLHMLLGNATLFYMLCVIGILAFLGDQGSLRVSVTASEVAVKNGFFFWGQTIQYDEIIDIIFKNSDRLNKVSVDHKRTFGNNGQRFIINTHDNDYYIVQSKHAQEVLDAIKKAHPPIKID